MAEKNPIEFITPSMRAMMDASPDIWVCKLPNTEFCYANPRESQLCGYTKPEDMIGDTDADIHCRAAKCAYLFQQQDREVLQTGKPLRLLDIQPYAHDEWHAYSVTKTPIFDAQQQPQAVMGHAVNITSSQTLELGQLLAAFALHDPEVDALAGANSYIISPRPDPLALTQQEAEMLFFLLRIPSLKGVARALDLSLKMVEQRLDTLKFKFGATHKTELLDQALRKGYLTQIPTTLFNQQLTVILREESCV